MPSQFFAQNLWRLTGFHNANHIHISLDDGLQALSQTVLHSTKSNPYVVAENREGTHFLLPFRLHIKRSLGKNLLRTHACGQR